MAKEGTCARWRSLHVGRKGFQNDEAADSMRVCVYMYRCIGV